MELTKIELRVTIDQLTESIINWEREDISLIHDGGDLERLKEVRHKLEDELHFLTTGSICRRPSFNSK